MNKSIIFYKNRFFKEEFHKIVNIKLKLDSYISSFHSSSPYYDKLTLINTLKKLNIYNKNDLLIECCSNIGSDTHLFINNYNKTISYECDEETFSYLVYNMFLLNPNNNIYFTGNQNNIANFIKNYNNKENIIYNNPDYNKQELHKVIKYRNNKDIIDYNRINNENIDINKKHNLLIYESFDIKKFKNIKDLYKEVEYVFYYDPPWMNDDNKEENKLYLKDSNGKNMTIEELIKITIEEMKPRIIIIKYRNKIILEKDKSEYKIEYIEIRNKENIIKYNFTIIYTS